MDYFNIRDNASGDSIKIGAEKVTESTDVVRYAAYHNVQHADPSNRVFGTSSTTDMSDHSLIASAGTGLKNYVTSIQIVNTGQTNAMITIKNGNGGSVLTRVSAPANYGASSHIFPVPIASSAATAIYFASDNVETGGTIYVSAQGYKAE